MQIVTLECHAPLAEDVFSLPALLESVTDTANLTVPDYLPKQLRGDARRLGYALKALFNGSCRFGEREAHLAAALKERTLTRMVLQFTISVENHTLASDNFQGAANYLATSGSTPHAVDGVGLAALVIEQMGGSLLIRTEREWCRTICCTVPLFPETDAFSTDGDPVPDKTPAALPTFKVLVAEDNLLQQTTLKHLLESVGCQAIVVSDGKAAVEEFEQGNFDVVLMDILMPVMDGFEATRLIRERERITGGAVPVVALTSYSLKAIQEKCEAVGMNGYLAKPVAKNKLLEALQRLNRPQELSVLPEVEMSDVPELAILEPRPVLENLDYDLDTYRELIDMYLNDYAAVGDQLAGKLSGDDLTDIKTCAHGLKGIAASIGGLRLADVANRIQEMCREGIKPECGEWAPRVTAETAALKAALEQLDQSALERLAAEQ
jgi:CheY-like chemotaxis protein/HPt (histidine-containing phosphotransfer) domain-containing protein